KIAVTPLLLPARLIDVHNILALDVLSQLLDGLCDGLAEALLHVGGRPQGHLDRKAVGHHLLYLAFGEQIRTAEQRDERDEPRSECSWGCSLWQSRTRGRSATTPPQAVKLILGDVRLELWNVSDLVTLRPRVRATQPHPTDTAAARLAGDETIDPLLGNHLSMVSWMPALGSSLFSRWLLLGILRPRCIGR